MPAQLVALTEGPSILLDKPIMLFGRHPECDIQIDSRKISRRHCCVAQVNDYLVVRDLGSTNGIRINGVRVLEGRIKEGDELTIGNFRYQVSGDEMEAVAPRPALRQVVPVAVPADEMLESCDEPVPLNDAEDVLEAVPTPRRSDPFGDVFRAAQSRPASPAASPHILPENLELAPVSDHEVPKNMAKPI